MSSVQNGGRLENYEKYLLKDINLYFQIVNISHEEREKKINNFSF